MSKNKALRLPALVLVTLALLAGCGGGSTSEESPPPDEPTDAERAEAAKVTADTNPMCADSRLGPYYWEVGSAQGVKVSGARGAGAPQRDTALWVFSASKWLYAANVVQKRGVQASDVPFLNFTSGYTNFGDAPLCLPSSDVTVEQCMLGRDGQNPATIGKFDYDSGHMQHHAIAVMGLGPADNAMLAADLNATLGDLGVRYEQPQPASGVVATPAAYAEFLRRLLSGELALGRALGSHKVCTDPSVCPDAYPDQQRPETWYYSLGHWVEDDPQTGDHAFSSPGGGGFYPWIDAGKRWYGMVARDVRTEADAGYHSAQCGRLIRQAWVTGQTVTSTTPSP